jgi:hypothetical protein
MRIVGSLATKYAPPYSLILHYFIGGTLLQLLLPVIINKDFISLDFLNINFAGIVHFYLLGFVIMIMMGALYQLIPVALEIPVFSFKIGYIQFYIYFFGFIIFISSMLKLVPYEYLPIGGFLLSLSFFLFIFNFFLSLRNLEKMDITVIALILAVIFLAFGVVIGNLLAFNFIYGFLQDITSLIQIHVILTIFGFIFTTVIGISMILLPMFSVSHKFKNIYSKISLTILFFSIVSICFSYLLKKEISIIFYYFLMVGMIIYIFQVYEIYKNKPKRKSDFPTMVMFHSHFFIPFSILSFFFSLKNAGLLFIMGFLGTLIYGSLYKIIPFLTWFHKFSDLVGKQKVPTLNEMLPKKIPEIQVIFYLTGIILLYLDFIFNSIFAFYLAMLTLSVSSVLFLYSFYFVLTYEVKEDYDGRTKS